MLEKNICLIPYASLSDCMVLLLLGLCVCVCVCVCECWGGGGKHMFII